MAESRKKKAQSLVGLDTTFYRELFRFYRDNRGSIRSHYHLLTRTLLDYNDPDKFRTGQFLRRPQFEALEIYIFLKEFLKLRPVHDIFADWYHRRNGFEKRGDVLGMGDQLALHESLAFNEEAYTAVFKRMKAARQDYPNYIFALTMGVGKTLLMAACVFYDFVLARKFPNDPLYCHNALIFAPDKTVLQSLREIEGFDFSKVLPPEHANWLQANLKLQYLDEAGATLNVVNNSDYNLIISNTQKILLKRKNKAPSSAEMLFLTTGETRSADTKSVYDDIADLYDVESPEDEADLTINQRFLKLRNLPQLGIFVDEAHHAFGDTLKKDMLDPRKETSLRFTINALAQGIKRLGSSMVACCNFTGTPYVKNEVLPEVVYSYSLKDAIDNGYLKTLLLHKFANTRDKEFVRAVVDDFLGKFDGRTLEGMLPKLVFFSPTIEDATGNLRPILEEELLRRGIPVSQILVNVGDPKVTSNDDIRAFNELDSSASEKRFLILVNKGKEGWNCRSLCGVAMFRQPKSRVFVLQASMRCLRAIGDQQEEGQVYLTDENAAILNEELQQNFRLTTDDLKRPERESHTYEVRVLKKKSISLTRVRHLYDCREKTRTAPIDFDMDNWDVERYRILHTEEKIVLQPGRRRTIQTPTDISYIKEQRTWSAYTLVAEIARYLCASPLKIETLLRESREGLDALVARVNQFNELLYDKVIPMLFDALYEVTNYDKHEQIEVDLVNEPVKGFFEIRGDPAKTQLFNEWHADSVRTALADKSFHLDTYCFDSMPEQDFFLNVIRQDAIKEVYFTGMLTHGQTDFHINYIDPDTHGVRSYYPDFLILTKNGDWLVVEVKARNMMDDRDVLAKQTFAETMLKASKISYHMVAHTDVCGWNVASHKN